MQDDKQKMTEHFIQVLPVLLERYGADAEKLTNLLAIPQYFDLEVYTMSRQEAVGNFYFFLYFSIFPSYILNTFQNLQAHLDKMGHIMFVHTDVDVLETCAKTLEMLCTEGSAIFTRCDVARSNIIDQCVNRYREAIDDWRNLIAGEETPDDDEIYNVNISLRKVSILYSCHNLNPCGLFESLFQDIEECQSGATSNDRGLPNEALVYCIESCFFSLSWGLYYLENTCDTASFPEALAELRQNLHKYLSACTELVRKGETMQVQEAVSYLQHFTKYYLTFFFVVHGNPHC